MKARAIEVVREYIDRARKLAPSITDDMLDSNGAIYYMNGNDGTDFDWQCNGRLCEFMVFGLNEMGFIKVCVKNDDTIYGWMYEDFGVHPTHTLEKEKLEDGAALHLANFLYYVTDQRGIWDVKIDELDFNEEIDEISSIFTDEQDDMDEWFEEEEE